MLALIQFESGRYGLQNQWTGIVLPKTFRSKRRALRHAAKLSRRLNKTMHQINNRLSKYPQ